MSNCYRIGIDGSLQDIQVICLDMSLDENFGLAYEKNMYSFICGSDYDKKVKRIYATNALVEDLKRECPSLTKNIKFVEIQNKDALSIHKRLKTDEICLLQYQFN